MREGRGGQRTVAALIGEGVLTFDFACACEIFGYDRSGIVTPWYRFVVASQDPGREAAQHRLVLPSETRSLLGADRTARRLLLRRRAAPTHDEPGQRGALALDLDRPARLEIE